MQREGHLHFAGIHALFEFLEAAYAADKIDALVAARIGDAEHRRDEIVLQQAHIEARDGIACGDELRVDVELVPLALEIHAEARRLVGLYLTAGFADVEALAQFGELKPRLKVH